MAPASLQPGTYNTSVVINPQNGSAVPPIPVTLVVSANALLTLSTNTLNFNAQFAGTSPAEASAPPPPFVTDTSVPAIPTTTGTPLPEKPSEPGVDCRTVG